MSIIRVHKRDNPFVQIDKRNINDPELSWKAKGILHYLLSKPNNWQVYERDILKHAPDGRDAVRAGIRELEGVGYIRRRRVKDSSGKWKGYDYDVYELPTVDGFSVDGKPAPTNNELNTNRREIFGGGSGTQNLEPCPFCGGTGVCPHGNPCCKCNGTGVRLVSEVSSSCNAVQECGDNGQE